VDTTTDHNIFADDTLPKTPSWQWYFPYHFAPFAADFIDVDKMDIKFVLGQPFKPFEQLMGVFPAAR
jgi:5'-3' exoribonuclease 2